MKDKKLIKSLKKKYLSNDFEVEIPQEELVINPVNIKELIIEVNLIPEPEASQNELENDEDFENEEFDENEDFEDDEFEDEEDFDENEELDEEEFVEMIKLIIEKSVDRDCVKSGDVDLIQYLRVALKLFIEESNYEIDNEELSKIVAQIFREKAKIANMEMGEDWILQVATDLTKDLL